MTEALKRAAKRIRSWRENPPLFAYENFKVDMDEWQEDAMRASGGPTFNPRRRLMMKACTGPGKSAVESWIGWFRLSCYGERGEHPKGAALSGEGRENLRDNLWAELSKWQQRSDFLKSTFTWTKERIYANDHAEDWFLAMRSYARDANPETIGTALSGLHSKFPFLLLDETGRMPVAVGQKATQIFTGGVVDGLIAGAGNPVSTSGLLYNVSEVERALWTLITITADPDDPKRTSRVDIEHAKEMIRLYGRDNPWVMATILGLFPPGGLNKLFSLEEVEASMKRHLREPQYKFAQMRIGVDVALYGDDRTVLAPRQGLAAFKPDIMRTQEPADISARLIIKKAELNSELELIDATGGWGSGVISHYKMAGYKPHSVQAAGRADDEAQFFNKRAEMWFRFRDWTRSGGALPNIPELVAELTAPEYTMKNGKILLMPKDLVKKAIGRSPDIADGYAQTFAIPDMPASVRAATGPGAAQHKSNWDPKF
jgi:phage terminase large subunit